MEIKIYEAGQIVSVANHSLSGPRTADPFRIVRRYPAVAPEAMYHLRSLVGRGQRMVPESELSSVRSPVFDRGKHPTKVLRLFPEVVRFGRGATP